jgi:hypothetical protein
MGETLLTTLSKDEQKAGVQQFSFLSHLVDGTK